MSLKKKDKKKESSGRSVEEDLQRLDDAGLTEGQKTDKEQKLPDTKEQQKTGDTTRSDRRL
jgi:hypothetical protein